MSPRLAIAALGMAMIAAACGSDGGAAVEAVTTEAEAAAAATTTEMAPTATPTTTPVDTATVDTANPAASAVSLQIEVWADNWMAVYVDGELVGEDSVSITTERSFNAEVFTFEASYPFTLAIEAKDFKETDSGIEYIGLNNQQMGDGGIIAQVTDLGTGEVVAATDSEWATLVVHRAPLNTECERDVDPDSTCEFEIIPTPDGWADADFDDTGWSTATEWSADAVSPKDGYDAITWDVSAQLIWGTDLEVDNTILLRTTVTG